MPILDLTDEQILAMTADQIKTALTSSASAKADKKELVKELFGKEEFADSPTVTYHKEDRQVATQTEKVRDADSVLLRIIYTTWDYFPKGEIQFIRKRTFDAAGKEQEKLGLEIEHFLDGKQPVSRVPKPLPESPFKPEKEGA